MASLFANRRKPKRVGRDAPSSEQGEDDDQDSGPVVRRPVTNAPKAKSKLRLSFNPGESDGLQLDDEPGYSSTPRAISKVTGSTQSTIAQSILRDSRKPVSEDRPAYNEDYLNELRNSTPSTPKDLSAYNSSTEDGDDAEVLDVASKFGQSRLASSRSIPTASEIQEKKQRRARMAKEQNAGDFISLEDYDSDGEFRPQRMQVSTFFREEEEKDTRLVRDDEDIAEGFDDFVEDSGRVTLSKKGARDQALKERENLRELIQEAEDSSDEDDSDAERNAAYELAQTSHGMDGLSGVKAVLVATKPKPPKEITPIPKLSVVLSRLRSGIQQLEFEKAGLLKRKADLQKEKVEIKAREENIQRLLTEAGEEFEKIKGDLQPSNTGTLNGRGVERGLESLGGTP